MSDESVTSIQSRLQVVTSTEGTSRDTWLASVLNVLRENEIIDEISDDDVELTTPRSGEVRLGPLNDFEKTCFIVGLVIAQTAHDELVAREADVAEKLTTTMRERNISMLAAQQIHEGEIGLDQEMQSFIRMCTAANVNLMSAQEWSVRTRFGFWDKNYIVRSGYEAYTYDG